jgi:hypothetical protein
MLDRQSSVDKESWNEFYQRYKGLVLRVAVKAGLLPDEASRRVGTLMPKTGSWSR